MTSADEEPRCVVCGGDTRTQFAATAPGFALRICDACGARRTWPAPSDAEIGAYYPASYYGRDDRRFVGVIDRATRLLRKHRAADIARDEPRGRALDVGCGGGFTLAELRARGFDAVGVELSDVSAHHARSALGLEVHTRLYDERLEARSFQIVIFWHSLEHLRAPQEALARAFALLAPGGLLVVAVPNSASAEARLFGPKWFHLDVPRHYHHFTTSSLRRLLEETGFTIEAVHQRNLEQNPYGVLQSALNALGFAPNLLYRTLKASPPVPGADDDAAGDDTRRASPWELLAMAALAPPLVVASLALSFAESLAGEGGTFDIRARKPF